MIKLKELLFLESFNRVGKATIYKKYFNILSASKDFDDLVSKMRDYSKFTPEDIDDAIQKAEKLYYDILNDSEIQVITIFDDNYPNKLRVMENKMPLILYVKGNIDALTEENIAVIGTRKPSKNSQEFEKDIVENILNNTGKVIVSGLALGCDKIAHETTVNEDKITIAVLPGGLNNITPASNRKLADEIISKDGCLITEYEPDAKAFKGTYVERDALVAAFCDETFVVECGVKSGTMHTVDAALKYEKKVFSYLPEDESLGDYSGNIKILDENNTAIAVNDVSEFLDNLKTDISSKQQTLI